MADWLTILVMAAACVAAGTLAGASWGHRRRQRLFSTLQKVQAERDRLRTSQSASGVGTWDWHVDSETLHWSDEVYPMFGFRPREVTPSYSLFCSMVHPEDSRKVREGEIACAEGHGPHDQEYRVVWRDGSVHWLREIGDTMRDAQGRPVRMIGTVRDVTEDKVREQRVLHLAFHDELTGLPNRAQFRGRLEDALNRARRHGTTMALAFIDLDRFKPINDTYGHGMGDAVLAEVAARLSLSVRAVDCVARLGGDEFVVILEDLRGSDEAKLLAAKILDVISTPMVLEKISLVLGASVGIALFPGDGERPDTLVEAADRAMYRAKTSRKGFVLASDQGRQERT